MPEVRIFYGERRHSHRIALTGVALLQDDAIFPLLLAGHNMHFGTDELRHISVFDFGKVQLVLRPAEPPTCDVERAR